MNKFLLLFFCLLSLITKAQSLQEKLAELDKERSIFQDSIAKIDVEIESTKLGIIQSDLKAFGIPKLKEGEELIMHSAMALSYSEKHEQANWVAHVITPDIINGKGARTNDFRIDPKIKSGTAIEEDYFLKTEKENGEYEYDGFGYDRGHLAPSADFRWSKKALSESYFYSNMSPQLADFNREIWADLENALRAYIYRNPKSKLYVTTGGILKDDLPAIERSVNKVSIPEYFYKVVIDRTNQRGIAFLLPHKKSDNLLETFALSINELEERTGFDFYNGLPDEEESKIEANLDKTAWLKDLQDGNVESLTLSTVPRKKSYPATFGKKFVNQDIKVNICGTVVGGRYSRKGNVLLNIDKKYPNQIFTVFIKKENLVNFSYDPLTLINSQICAKGTVASIGKTPTMFLEDENKLELINQ